MSDRAASLLTPTTALSVETVGSVHHWNEHLFSFTISRPASFRFRSGEFVLLGLPEAAPGSRPLLRAYSIASPSWAEELEFLSIKVPGGPLTSRLQQIVPGSHVFLGRKPTGTLVSDALHPGKRLFMLATGTGLAPFLSLARDPDIYQMFDQLVIVHSVRRVSDLAHRVMLESHFADDPLVNEEALLKFHYLPTVTREPFPTSGRIGTLIESGALFDCGVTGPRQLDPHHDRVMLCGSLAMIKDLAADLERRGFEEGSNANPGQYVIERAFSG